MRGFDIFIGALIGIDKVCLIVIKLFLENYQKFSLMLYIAIGLYEVEELEDISEDEIDTTHQKNVKEEKLLINVFQRVKLYIYEFSMFKWFF